MNHQAHATLRTGAIAAALGSALIASLGSAQADPRATLVGFASLPADTFAEGPSSGGDSGDGTPIAANGRSGPFDSQPVQGFSGVQFAPGEAGDKDGAYWFLSDNGFGAQGNSADYLLRLYQVRPDFIQRGKRGKRGNRGNRGNRGSGEVAVEGFVQLSDPNGLIPFEIVNEGTAGRLLTGADFDIESFVFDGCGDLWIGDEFGPFVLHFDAEGTLLEAPIPTPDLDGTALSDTAFVRAPQNPYLDGATPNLSGSRGYEGMAFSPDRKTAYPLLEGTVSGDPEGSLRIYAFDLTAGAFSGFVGFFGLDAPNHAIGDFTPINDHEFLIIERDGGQGDAAQFKKIFKVDIDATDAAGFVEKTLVVDLLNVADPADLNGDGSTLFTFPFVTIEDVLVLGTKTILVANDNNYPFSLGRGPDIDNNEIIELKLDAPLAVDRSLLRDSEARCGCDHGRHARKGRRRGHR